jgi:hypothetical protein
MTERTEELDQYLATLEKARNGDDTAAQAAREQYRRKQRQAMGPPDVERAQDLYRDGEIDEQELDALIESAMEHYPPDGHGKNPHRGSGVNTDAAAGLLAGDGDTIDRPDRKQILLHLALAMVGTIVVVVFLPMLI